VRIGAVDAVTETASSPTNGVVHDDEPLPPAPSPPVSQSKGMTANDILMQLRAYKERSSRMELLLAKKSAKIQEQEETVSTATNTVRVMGGN
jgi:hypothetical protein